jgi:hypothetical protein
MRTTAAYERTGKMDQTWVAAAAIVDTMTMPAVVWLSGIQNIQVRKCQL